MATVGYRGLKGVTGGLMRLRELTGDYKVVQRVTGGWSTLVSSVVFFWLSTCTTDAAGAAEAIAAAGCKACADGQ